MGSRGASYGQEADSLGTIFFEPYIAASWWNKSLSGLGLFRKIRYVLSITVLAHFPDFSYAQCYFWSDSRFLRRIGIIWNEAKSKTGRMKNWGKRASINSK